MSRRSFIEGGMLAVINLDTVRDSLRTVLDPEIGVNVVDLGLIYDIAEPKAGQVYIKMTLTTPECPLQEGFLDAIESAVGQTEGVEYVKVDLVFDPPWTPDLIDSDVKAELGLQ